MVNPPVRNYKKRSWTEILQKKSWTEILFSPAKQVIKSIGLLHGNLLGKTTGEACHAMLQFPLDGLTLTQITWMPLIFSQLKEPISLRLKSISISISFLSGKIVFNQLSEINGSISHVLFHFNSSIFLSSEFYVDGFLD